MEMLEVIPRESRVGLPCCGELLASDGIFEDSLYRLYRNGPCFRLWDSNNKCRLMFQMDAADGPSVVVYDENEEPVQQLRLPK